MIDDGGPRTTAEMAAILRKARIRAGRTQREAANALGSSLSTISRLEAGKRRVTPLVAYTLLRFYDHPRELASKISGHEVVGHPPLEAFDAGIPPWLRPFLEYEGMATGILQYQRDMLPGLLRSPAHPSSVGVYQVPGTTTELEVELQTRRLSRFLAGSTRLHAIVEESALVRQLMACAAQAQTHIDHLLTMAAHERVTVQVLPIAAGPAAGMSATFTVFTLPEHVRPAGAVSMSLMPGTMTYMTLDGAYDMHRTLFADLAGAALDPAGSVELIEDLRSSLR